MEGVPEVGYMDVCRDFPRRMGGQKLFHFSVGGGLGAEYPPVNHSFHLSKVGRWILVSD